VAARLLSMRPASFAIHRWPPWWVVIEKSSSKS
jgi:hypothetical protein